MKSEESSGCGTSSEKVLTIGLKTKLELKTKMYIRNIIIIATKIKLSS
jgi:hypothetical protein